MPVPRLNSFVAPPDPRGSLPRYASSIYAHSARREFIDGATGELVQASMGIPHHVFAPFVHPSEGLLLQSGYWQAFTRSDGELVSAGHDPDEVLHPWLPIVSQSFGHYRVIDMDRDGHLEVVAGRRVYAFDGSLLAEIDVDYLPNTSALLDANGDGRVDIVAASGTYDVHGSVLCELDPYAFSYPTIGGALPVDLDGDGNVEILVSPLPTSDGRAPERPLRVQDTMCGVLKQAALTGRPYDRGTATSVTHVGRFLDGPGQQLIAVGYADYRSVTVLYDENLDYVGPVGLVASSSVAAVDLDGDGRLEVVSYRNYAHAGESAPRENRLIAYDLQHGTTTVMNDGATPASSCMPADGDGDGHIELYCFEDRDGEQVLVAYEGADGPWASGYRFFWRAMEGYLFTPDGYPNSGPVDFSELGGFNYLPSADPWVGANSDLIVRIADVCDEECEEGWMVAWVQIGNQGRVGVSRPVVARLYGERDGVETLVAEVRRDTAPMGWWSAAEPLRFPAAGYERLRAVVSGDDWDVQECDTTNNEDVWELVCG